MKNNTLLFYVKKHAKERPNDFAFCDLSGERLTWGKSDKKITDLLDQLKNVILPGHRVVLQGDNSVATVFRLIVLAELGASVALCTENANDYAKDLRAHFVWGDSLAEQETTAPLSSHDLAFFFRTTGTTGSRKIVSVPSFRLHDLWEEQSQVFSIDKSSKSVWMLSPNFDASLSDIGVAVFSGAELLCVPQGSWLRPATWKKDMEKYEITHIDAPPAWLSLCAKNAPPCFLKTAVVGGEPCPPSLVRSWSSFGVRFVNVYGPTECTVCTSMEILSVSDERPTLGWPMKNVEYKILKNGHPVAPVADATGELVIFCKGLALDYFEDPDATQDRFGDDGLRFFKTRDEVLCLPDGRLQFLGRLNRSIKHNGRFVNLDTIELFISSIPGVMQVGAIYRAGQVEVFYSGSVDEKNLRRLLSEKKFLAHKITKLPSLPIVNSKINRSAL